MNALQRYASIPFYCVAVSAARFCFYFEPGISLHVFCLRMILRWQLSPCVLLTHDLFLWWHDATKAKAEYEAAGDVGRSSKEQRDIDFLLRYLPKQITAEELDALAAKTVADLGVTDHKGMGKVIGVLKKQLGASAPGGNIADAVKRAISA